MRRDICAHYVALHGLAEGCELLRRCLPACTPSHVPYRCPPLRCLSLRCATAVGSLPTAVKAAAALAFVSAVVDVSGGKLVGSGMVDDGATPPRRIYPYTSS